MINIAICDDEQCFYERIRRCVDNYMQKKNMKYKIKWFESGEELLEFRDEIQGYTIIFLDINMYGIDGYEAAQKIRECNKDAFIVFVTAYFDYSTEGYKVDAIRYVIKDELFADRMAECLDAVFDKMQDRLPMLTLNFAEGMKVFSPNDLVYIESRLHRIEFHIESFGRINTYTTNGVLDEYEKMLEESSSFLRIHKSYLINMKYVDTIGNSRIEMVGGATLPVPKGKFREIKREILEFLGEF